MSRNAWKVPHSKSYFYEWGSEDFERLRNNVKIEIDHTWRTAYTNTLRAGWISFELLIKLIAFNSMYLINLNFKK